MADFTITFWLVIRIGILGQPLVTVEDTLQPDRQTCVARAAEALEKAEMVGGYDEFFATCSIVRAHADPA